MSNGVLPGGPALAVVGELLDDVVTNLPQSQHLVGRLGDGHGNEGDVGVGRLDVVLVALGGGVGLLPVPLLGCRLGCLSLCPTLFGLSLSLVCCRLRLLLLTATLGGGRLLLFLLQEQLVAADPVFLLLRLYHHFLQQQEETCTHIKSLQHREDKTCTHRLKFRSKLQVHSQ